MSTLFGRKTAGTKMSAITYARGLVVALYVISWAFSLCAAMLVETNNYNELSCTMSIYSCIVLYASSKIIIYLFLMEKVYVVTAVGTTRVNFLVRKTHTNTHTHTHTHTPFHTPLLSLPSFFSLFPFANTHATMKEVRVSIKCLTKEKKKKNCPPSLDQLYRINIALLVPFLAIFCLMMVYRISDLQQDGLCYIGLLPPASVTLILYDIFISSWLTILFIRPLTSSTSMLQGPSKSRLRDVARRTLVGSLVSLLLSTANIFTLVLFRGQERGLICLASCTVDVTLNAMSVHWITSRGNGSGSGGGGSSYRHHRKTLDQTSMSRHGKSSRASEKLVTALDSHLSFTVESYVEQYHQPSVPEDTSLPNQ